jgi:hypothetical protein
MRLASSTSSTRAAQAGQGTFEFALVILFVVIMLSALYQALHFELDVFNRISLLRFRIMQDAHDKQYDRVKSFPTESMDFRNISDLTPVLLMTQSSDSTLQYGPKSLRYRVGTKYTEPFPISALPEGGLVLGGVIIIGVGTSEYKENSRRFRDHIRQGAPLFIAQYPDLGDQ